MKLKAGVKVLGTKPEILFAILAADQIWREMGQQGVTVTSLVDGHHSAHSDHYKGEAVDLRIWDIDARDAVGRLEDALGEDYFILLEKDHIHISYRPTRTKQ